MILTGKHLNENHPTPQNAFITIARMALHTIENEPDAKFKSQLDLFSMTHSGNHQLPEALMPLARLNLLEYDTSAINLTTSTNTVWTGFDTAAYNEKRMHTARFELDLAAGSSTYRNEAQFYIYVTVPSGETAYSLGIATYESAPAQ